MTKIDQTPSDRILVVGDEENMRALFENIIRTEGYQVAWASTGEEAIALFEEERFDLVVSDLKMPGMDGFDLLKKIKEISPGIPFIFLTALGTIGSAVAAMKEGVFDYLTKPVNIDEVKLVIKKALGLHHITEEVAQLRARVEINKDFKEIIGRSPKMRALFRMIKLVSISNATILIYGESGTGKELIARAVHYNSPRHNCPFITIDCGALPETLLESELFGHAKGSFTGAIQNKKGLFEEANGGTLLLDEIGDTTLAFQSKLLRVVQEGEIRPVGSNKSIKVDVRLLVATNKDLRKLVKMKTFREDLYYRLAVVPVVIPSLKERKEDIPLLVDHFIKKFSDQNHLPPKRISPQVMKILIDYPWPGNVRMLENVIERAVLISPGPEIQLNTLFNDQAPEERTLPPLREMTDSAIQVVERENIAEAMRKANGNRSQAARLLEISRSTLYNKLRQYGLL
jgi:DNA-binding NtrC family response regulator